MYAALPPQANRLFPGFVSVTSKLQGSNLTVAPMLTLKQHIGSNIENDY